MSTYVIGDVQGCFNELQTLLKLIAFNPEHDRLWFVGDLVNRGEDSLSVLRLIKSFKDAAVVVLGNHDLHLLAVAYGVKKLRETDTFQAVLDAPDSEALLFWLRHQPLLHYDSCYNAVMTHAGLPMQWDLTLAIQCADEVATLLRSKHYIELLKNMYGNEPSCWDPALAGWARYRFIINALTRMRFCDVNGCLDATESGVIGSQPVHLIPWFDLPTNRPDSLLVLFGHWAALNGETNKENIIALDTGCAWGNKLTAFCLDDRKRFHVNRQPTL